MSTYFIPLYILGGLLFLLLVLALLARVRGGRYLQPIFAFLAKVPFMKKLLAKASNAALERQNPELASAIKKLERSGAGATTDPRRAQAALGRLTADERRAYMEAAGEQGAIPEGRNRAERRRLEKMQTKTAQRRKKP